MSHLSSPFSGLLSYGRRSSELRAKYQPGDAAARRRKAKQITESSRDTPSLSASSANWAPAASRDATRCTTAPSVAQQPPPQQRPSNQLNSTVTEPEKRASDLSVITRVRIPTSDSNPSATRVSSRQASGRTSPVSDATPQEEGLNDVDGHASVQLESDRSPNASSSRSGGLASEGTHALETASVGSDGALRRVDSQKTVSMNPDGKLENMAETSAASHHEGTSTTDFARRGNNDDLPAAPHPAPAIPARSPLRENGTLVPSGGAQASTGSESERSAHASPVASFANPESDNATANSDVFTQEDDASSFTSQISSNADLAHVPKDKPMTPAGVAEGTPRGYVGGRRQPSPPRITPERPLQSGPTLQPSASKTINQTLPAPPGASLCYDMLAMRSDSAFGQPDFALSLPPYATHSPASSLTSSSSHNQSSSIPDLSRRPPSPALSDISDAESFDSACPPPVALHRDVAGPKYRNNDDRRRAGLSKQASEPAAKKPVKSPTTPQHVSRGKTSFNSSADGKGKVDLTVRPPSASRGPSRAGSLPSPTTAVRSSASSTRSTRSAGSHREKQKQGGFSLAAIFGRSKKKEAELPPLRKITFDSRGNKRVVDLNMNAAKEIEAELFAGKTVLSGWNGAGEVRSASLSLPASRSLRSLSPTDFEPSDEAEQPHHEKHRSDMRKGSMDARLSISTQRSSPSLGTTQQGQGGAPGTWRVRERGAPRRTAWK